MENLKISWHRALKETTPDGANDRTFALYGPPFCLCYYNDSIVTRETFVDAALSSGNDESALLNRLECSITWQELKRGAPELAERMRDKVNFWLP